MKKTIRAIKRGVKAALGPSHPQRFRAGGKLVACSHCGANTFERYGVMGAAYGGYGLHCLRCSHIEYFGRKPSEIENDA